MQSFNVWKSQYPESWFSCIPGKNGFLPVDKPLEKLPEEYEIINELLDKMKLTQKSGERGFLYHGMLRQQILDNLPVFDFTHITDKRLLSGLHRDYCFLAAAYSLEPSHLGIIQTGDKYGKAENLLPPQLAIPLICLGKKNFLLVNQVFEYLKFFLNIFLLSFGLFDSLDAQLHMQLLILFRHF